MHCNTKPFPISKILVEKNVIDLNPVYQRESAIWSMEKQQLFIDSIFNSLDVPKFYFHDLRGKDPRYDYAVIDGKQRLYTIFKFFDDELPLSSSFELFEKTKDPSKGEIHPGSKFTELTPKWQESFKGYGLDIVLVVDAEDDDIEELFSRLNNGEPLTAAEKRNAMGGDMAILIREIAKHKFFKKQVTFSNKRYQHYEAAAKLLLIEHHQMTGSDYFCDLKKKYLDNLVENNKQLIESTSKSLQKRVIDQLNSLSRVFSNNDHLLSKQAYAPLYYLFIKTIEENYTSETLYSDLRKFIEKFYSERIKNLQKSEEERDSLLIEFSRLMQQGTNDKLSLKERVNILIRYFLLEYPETHIKDPRRAFTEEERIALWVLAGKKCQKCGRELKELGDMWPDHIIQWAHGGPTSLKNGNALCESCNREIAEKRK